MRFVVLCLFLVMAAVGCGPSAAEVKQAQTARYKKSPGDLYSIAQQTAAADYKIGEEDRANFRFATLPQWYSPEGGRQSAGAGDMVQIEEGSVRLEIVVAVVEADDDAMMVTVTPVVFQHVGGSPQPRQLVEDDPNMPPWVHGRVESLQTAIYNNAKSLLAQP